MENLIKKIEDGFCEQEIFYVKGWNNQNEEFQFVRYFETNNCIKYMAQPKDGLPYTKVQITDFETAFKKFLSLCDQTWRDVEVVDIWEVSKPLHHYNFN